MDNSDTATASATETFIKNWNDFIHWEQKSRDTIDFKTVYVDIAGDIMAGLLLSQIIYWNLPSKKGDDRLRIKKNGKQWLAKKHSEWWNEIRLTENQARRAICLLKKKGFVETAVFKFRGNPTNHIHLKKEVVTQCLSVMGSSTEGNGTQHRRKWDTAQKEMGHNPEPTHAGTPMQRLHTETTYRDYRSPQTPQGDQGDPAPIDVFEEEGIKASSIPNPEEGMGEGGSIAIAETGNGSESETREPPTPSSAAPPPPKKRSQRGWEPEAFDEFYAAYPKKPSGPGPSRKKWNQLRPDPQQVMDALDNWRRSKQWQDTRFIPAPEVWLNKRRYEADFSTIPMIDGLRRKSHDPSQQYDGRLKRLRKSKTNDPIGVGETVIFAEFEEIREGVANG